MVDPVDALVAIPDRDLVVINTWQYTKLDVIKNCGAESIKGLALDVSDSR